MPQDWLYLHTRVTLPPRGNSINAGVSGLGYSASNKMPYCAMRTLPSRTDIYIPVFFFTNRHLQKGHCSLTCTQIRSNKIPVSVFIIFCDDVVMYVLFLVIDFHWKWIHGNIYYPKIAEHF